MKLNHFILTLLGILFIVACNSKSHNSKDNQLSATDDIPIYLGQNPPGLTPELFAPDIIRTEFREGAYAFTPDLKEFYLRRRGGQYTHNTLMVIKYEDNQWTESLVAPKGGEPFITQDGNTMHLGRRYRTRTAQGWSDDKPIAPPFDTYRIMRLTVASNGTYYFDDANENVPIKYARLINGSYETPQTLAIEVGPWNAHPYIAPDESYIIWDDQRDSGFGGADLYISFKQKDGSWGSAINLGDNINSEFNELYGSISPDGKYFFFIRSFGGNKADIYWMDVKKIMDFKPKED